MIGYYIWKPTEETTKILQRSSPKLKTFEFVRINCIQMKTCVWMGLSLERTSPLQRCDLSSNSCWERCLHLVFNSVLSKIVLNEDYLRKSQKQRRWRFDNIWTCKFHFKSLIWEEILFIKATNPKIERTNLLKVRVSRRYYLIFLEFAYVSILS